MISDILIKELLDDVNYGELVKLYNEKHIIDVDLVESLLNTHLDLYKLFIKSNIFLYGYISKYLDDELKDCTHFNNKDLYIEDVNNVMSFYYDNYLINKKCLRRISMFRFRPSSERVIINKIIKRTKIEEYKIPNDKNNRVS